MTYKDLDYILERIEDNTLPKIYKPELGRKIEKVKSMIKKAKYKNEVPPRYIRVRNG